MSEPAPALDPRRARLELVAVVVLSLTTILTAWSAFQSSKWGGAMSIAFSEASSARIEATRVDATANVRTSNHIGLWTEWVAAEGAGQDDVADFLVARFPPELTSAHEEWLAAGGVDADAESPFALASYELPERVEAERLRERAAERFATALANNQRGDNYTVLTVLFAAVLFFVAMSGRVTTLRAQQLLMGLGLALGVVGLVMLLVFPKLV
ncbi:hypothetical protein [Aquipuribacter sp. SD81]|uniref:hypothetical protein n=1 Tax=Aquipuribacter sp. SD81 TaxID=3127703 RepID=UPI0030196DB3